MLSPEAQVIQTLFPVQDKTGKSVPFLLNPSQLAYDSQKTGRNIIAKCRQKGFSTYRVAEQLVKCLGVEGTRAVLMSHEAKATERLLDKVQFMLKYIKGPKAELGRHSRNELYFPKTESTYYIGTAGAKAFGRGDTITDLHMSEYAWWDQDGVKVVAGLMQAVPLQTGNVCIESTSNGRANDYYYMCMHAEQLGYNLFFRAWWEDDEYQLAPPEEGWQPEGFEHYFQDMKLKYNLNEKQLYWYWFKLLEFRLNLKTMQQEYPSSLEESFQATGGGVFEEVPYIKKDVWTWDLIEGKRCNYLPGHPKPNHHYVLGADPSGGTGNDDAAIQIICLETLEQVLSFYDNTVDPVAFGHYLALLGSKYNSAWLVIESNNHGIATLAIVKEEYPKQLIYKRKIGFGKMNKPLYGFMNTEATKKELVGNIHEVFEMDLRLYDPKTKEELQGFMEDPQTHRMEGPEDDLVIALGLACTGVKKYYPHRTIPQVVVPRPQYQPGSFKITMQDILDSLNERRKTLKAFGNQVRER